MNSRLDGQVVLLTGATGSIGSALALELASLGAKVVLLGRNKKKLDSLYNSIVEYGYTEPSLVAIDLLGATDKDHQDLIQLCEEQFKDAFSHIICCAGNCPPLSMLEHHCVKQWYNTIQINFHSVFLLMQAALPVLKKRKNANIVFSFAADDVNNAYFGAYSAANAALLNLFSNLSKELENTAVSLSGVELNKINSPLYRKNFPSESISSLITPDEIVSNYTNLLLTADKKMHAKIIKAEIYTPTKHINRNKLSIITKTE